MKVKLLFLLLILGCFSFSMNPVTTKYESVKNEKIEKDLDKKDIQVLRSENLENDYRMLFEEGYEVLGSSNFESFKITESTMKSHAKKIGAGLVLYSETFKNKKEFIEWDPFVRKTHCYEHDRDIFDDCSTGDWVYVYRDDYLYNIVFLNKVELTGIGISVKELSVEKRKEIESNYGLEIESIRKDSEAYRKNVLPDDVITEVNGNKILTEEEYEKILLENKGKTINIEILRKGKLLNKELLVY